MIILGIHRLLSVLHPRIFPNHMTIVRPHKKCNTVALECQTTNGIWRTTGQDVHKASPTITELQKNILSTNWCFGIWCRSCTLTEGRIHEFQTQMSPRRLLFHHLYANRTTLNHLQMRILSCHQGPGELEGLPHLDEDPVHHQNQPQEPHILEQGRCGRRLLRSGTATTQSIPKRIQGWLRWITRAPYHPSPTNDEQNHGWMDKRPTYCLRWASRQAHLETRALGLTGNSTRRWNQKGGHLSVAWSQRGGALRVGWNDEENSTRILMAKGSTMDWPICKRMCNLSTEQH